ncbi:MAG: DUF3108 domain-containing protein [Bacteroidaceae bacterium]|nr:DUF3108 domain-containing protein [Bacteroidaceae bacterium]
MKSLFRLLVLVSALFVQTACIELNAQCKYPNTAFNPGESLNYDLYFNWKFVWVKCGSTHFSINNATYNGKKALRTDILFKSNKTCAKVFPMRDTLISYTTPDLVPLYFRKGAFEGKRYTVDEVWYSYPGGKTVMKQKYRDPDGDILNHQSESEDCVNDMLNILLLARSRDYSKFKEGQRMEFKMVTGKRISNQILIFKGRKTFKANDEHTYKCLVFSLLDDKEKKEKELLRFYITDDKNHLPVRIDFYLKFGVAKAYFLHGTGMRNPMTARIK